MAVVFLYCLVGVGVALVDGMPLLPVTLLVGVCPAPLS